MNETEDPGYTIARVEQGPPCCDPEPVIEIAGLSISYGRKAALTHVDLDIYRGCITALIGPSGCGKTSLLSALNRMTDLIPGCKVEGSIRYGGVDVRNPSLNVAALRRQIGMIFQRPNPFPFSIRRNLEMPLREHGIKNRTELSDRMERSLTDAGLWLEVRDRLHSPALALSGGQQQRLCIARALVLEPSVLLMDEPCSALDPLSSGVVEDLIESLRNRYTVVIVTHNLAQARRIANYAAFFWMPEQAGKLIEFGQCRQIFETPEHKLTASYIRGLRG